MESRTFERVLVNVGKVSLVHHLANRILLRIYVFYLQPRIGYDY